MRTIDNSLASRIGKLEAGISELTRRVEKINTCHVSSGPDGGQFCSGGGGGPQQQTGAGLRGTLGTKVPSDGPTTIKQADRLLSSHGFQRVRSGKLEETGETYKKGKHTILTSAGPETVLISPRSKTSFAHRMEGKVVARGALPQLKSYLNTLE